MRIEEFNRLTDAEAADALRACARIDSWVEALLAARPYDDSRSLLRTAHALTLAWTPAEVDGALADHPRIGERPAGASAHSRAEQAGVDAADADLAERLRAGNLAYEKRFDRIYLVRAKGRSGPAMLALLEERLGNDPATEIGVVAEQLGEIALLRLADLLEADVDEAEPSAWLAQVRRWEVPR